MNRREFLSALGLSTAGLMVSPLGRAAGFDLLRLPQDANGTRWAEGFVFEDRDGSGRRKTNAGLPNVLVSNGREIVKTGRDGKWRLPVDENSVLFVIKPRGWQVPVDANGIPRGYYLHKPQGARASRYPGSGPTGALPASLDFPLRRQKENDAFRMVMFGDPQPRDQKEIDYMAHDVIEQVVRDAAAMDAKFGMSLGDIMFDNLSLYDSLNRTVGRVGLPWYNVVGNHDLNFDSPDTERSTETFQKTYGPTHFAFEYGRVCFLVLNSVWWRGVTDDGKPKGYHGEFTKEQLEFVKNYMPHVPKDRLLVVAAHQPHSQIDNIRDLYALIQDHPQTLSFSAHTHVAEHSFIGADKGWMGTRAHHHVNHVTVCGSWWGGSADERGIPHATMSDGGPNGYSMVEFDGVEYKITFRPASRPVNEQMGIWLPESVTSAMSGDAEVVVNVFAGSERSTVEMRVGTGAWVSMPTSPRRDPYYERMKEAQTQLKVGDPGYYRLPAPSVTPHIWAAKLPAGLPVGSHLITVRTRDMFGQEYVDHRIVRVTAE